MDNSQKEKIHKEILDCLNNLSLFEAKEILKRVERTLDQDVIIDMSALFRKSE